MFLNGMQLLQWDRGDRMVQFGHENQALQKKCIILMHIFFRTALGAPSSTADLLFDASANSRAAVPSATSTSTVEIRFSAGFRFHSRTIPL